MLSSEEYFPLIIALIYINSFGTCSSVTKLNLASHKCPAIGIFPCLYAHEKLTLKFPDISIIVSKF